MFKSSWWRRRWVRVATAGVLLIVLILLIGPSVAKPFVRAKLQSMIREQLNAELEIGGLAYEFPYGVSVSDARLVASDTDGKPVDLLSAKHVSIALAKLPIFPGPLVIRSIVVHSPAVHLIETRDGLVGRGITNKPDQPAPQRRQKLSEIFELHRLALSDGQIVYEDRSIAGAVPLVWRGLQIDLKTGAHSSADYDFDVTAGAGNAASLSAKGSLDIDELILHMQTCGVKVRVDPANSGDSAIPAELQPLLREYQIAGELAIDVSGDVPIADPDRANVTATIDLPRASGKIPGSDAPLDELSMRLTTRAEPTPVANGATTQRVSLLRLNIERMLARGRDSAVRIDGGSVVLNNMTGAWGTTGLKVAVAPGSDLSFLPRSLRELLAPFKVTGQVMCTIEGSGPLAGGDEALKSIDAHVQVSPQELVVQVPQLPLPLRDFADAEVQIANGVATIENIRAGYGPDVLLISHARVPFDDLLRGDVIHCKELSGCVTLAKQPATYPPPLAEYIAQAQPHGPFWFTGWASADLSKPDLAPNYQIRITTDRGAISTRTHHIPLHNVNADIVVTPTLAQINRFDADVLSGKLWTTAHIQLGNEVRYEAQIRTRGIDLNELAQLAVNPGEKPITVSGELDVDMTLSGSGTDDKTAPDNLRGEGAVRVLHGELLRVPVLDHIADAVGRGRLATVGEAGCAFKLADRKIELTDAAVGSPALGIRGNGEIGFDGALALDVIATPLNKWDQQIRREHSGSVRNFVATVAGNVQDGMDKVTAEFLYRLHVGGTLDKPDVNVVAAPSLQSKK